MYTFADRTLTVFSSPRVPYTALYFRFNAAELTSEKASLSLYLSTHPLHDLDLRYIIIKDPIVYDKLSASLSLSLRRRSIGFLEPCNEPREETQLAHYGSGKIISEESGSIGGRERQREREREKLRGPKIIPGKTLG